MFESLLGKKKIGPHYVLAVDMGTASLSAALVEKLSDKKHKIIKVFRYRFDLLSAGFEKRGAQVILSGVRKVFEEAHSLQPDISCILFSFSDLLVTEYSAKKRIERKPPFSPITEKELESQLGDWSESLLAKHEGMVLAKRNILKYTVNGYPVESPVNYRGQFLDVDIDYMLISQLLADSIRRHRERYYPASKIFYYSDPQVFRKVLEMTENTFEPTLVVDVGGEITSVFLISEETKQSDPIIFGIRTLERRAASYFKCPVSQAAAMVSKYKNGVLDDAKMFELEKVINAAMEDWAHELKTRIVQIAPHAQKIVLSGGGVDFKVFQKTVKNYYAGFSPNADISTMKAEAFKDYFESMNGLKSGGDVILACLILYCA